MTDFVGRPATQGLRGQIRVPGDKSVSHRALLMTAAAQGTSHISGLSRGEDVLHTLDAIRSFGADVEESGGGTISVAGGRLHEPPGVVDVGNSGTAIRLIAGWAAGIDGLCVLAGDSSIARRPMDRIADPLRAMGALVDGRQGGRYPPLTIRGGSLVGIDYSPPVPSAQVKSAILLAGLSASGETTVRESSPTRVHTEEMLEQFGADVVRGDGFVSVRRSSLHASDVDVPGDPSQAAFWVVAAVVTPGSCLEIPNVYVGPGRAGFLDVLQRMGAEVQLSEIDPSASTATITARHSSLKGTDVVGEEVPALIDEIPVLAVAGAFAEGATSFSGAGELRVKESDRIATMTEALRAVGVEVEPRDDGLVVHGSENVAGGQVDAAGDHRVAMAMAVASLAATRPTTVRGWESVATSYPGFEQDYLRCQS